MGDPNGEHDVDEDPWEAARREFAEELGCPVPEGLGQECPELDRLAWLSPEQAGIKLLHGQRAFLPRLAEQTN